jgi:hypothetical protein
VSTGCPLHPDERTLRAYSNMSAKRQKGTHAPQQTAYLFAGHLSEGSTEPIANVVVAVRHQFLYHGGAANKVTCDIANDDEGRISWRPLHRVHA